MAGKPKLTVGSLRGIPQLPGLGRAAPTPALPERGGANGYAPPALPPAKRGRGCCRKGCAGCPWAEAQRRQLLRR